MIIEYHRPTSIEEALTLLSRTQPVTVPLGGGSWLNSPSPEPVAAVDLQPLGLDDTLTRGNSLEVGAALSLQRLFEAASGEAPLHLPPDLGEALRAAARHEGNYNLRQVATVAGTLVAADGRSPFTTALLALDAVLTLLPGEEKIGLGELLPFRTERLRGKLITKIVLPLNARLAYESVARTPDDRPIVCAAAAAWPSGRVRVALGGYGNAPKLALDGTEPDGVEAAARSAYSDAGDAWASAEYRQAIAGVLAKRCVDRIFGGKGWAEDCP